MFKNIAMINGRGVEGCGMTQHLHQYELYFNKLGITNNSYVSVDRKFSRGFSQEEDTKDWIKFKFADKSECEKYQKEINENADLIIYLGMPAKAKKGSKGNDQEVVDNYYDYFVYGIDKDIPKMYLGMDHSVHSIIRNARWQELAENVDMYAIHALDDDFARKTKKENLPPKPMVMAPCTFDIQELRDEFWKPMDEKLDRTYGWIGRSVGWKGPELAYAIHEAGLRDAGFVTTLEGLELSIGSLGLFFKNANRNDGPREDVLQCFSKKDPYTAEGYLEARDKKEPALAFGPYKRVDALHRLSKKKFGSNLYNLNARMYGATFEMAHMECVGAGVIPVFHKHHGMNSVNLKTGKPHYDKDKTLVENMEITGVIWADYDNVDEVSKLMIELDKDNEYYDRIREKSFEYWNECYTADFVYGELVKDIEKVAKLKAEGVFPIDISNTSPTTTNILEGVDEKPNKPKKESISTTDDLF
jgi:glycosyltransferase involved in cell wall biosynthesis